MAKSSDIESLRQLLQDQKVHIEIGQILQLDLAKDRSVWRVKVKILPDDREVVARMTWDQAGPESGIYGPAEKDDLVLLAYVESEELNLSFVIRRLSTKNAKIPIRAGDGHTFIKARPGKNLYLGSEAKTLLGKLSTETDPNEPMLLGNVVKALFTNILTQIEVHTHLSSAPGSPTSPPVNAPAFTELKASPVADNGINSDIIFGEKG